MATKNNEQKDGLALIVGGLFVLALVFAAYNYFNRAGNMTDNREENGEMEQRMGNGDQEGDLNGDGAFSQRNGDVSGDSTTGDTGQETNMISTWTANDYQEGDIQGDTYTVVWGDTLWEIAEAIYGNGAEWTRILEANQSDIGFLPNGQQALIFPGQVLTLP